MACGRSPFTFEKVDRHMSEKTKKYFQAPDVLLSNALQKVNTSIRFQQMQYEVMREKIGEMRGQLDNIVDRYTETAKQYDALKKNANSLMTHFQHHQGVLRELNGSLIECMQSLQQFADTSTKNDNSLGIDLRWPASSQNSPTISFLPNEFGKEGISVRDESLMSLSERWNGSLLNFDASRTESAMGTPALNNRFTATPPFPGFHPPMKASSQPSGNLEAVFGIKNWTDSLKLTQPSSSSSNPYKNMLSKRNHHQSPTWSSQPFGSATALTQKTNSSRQPNSSVDRSDLETFYSILGQSSISQCTNAEGGEGMFGARGKPLSRSQSWKSNQMGEK